MAEDVVDTMKAALWVRGLDCVEPHGYRWERLPKLRWADDDGYREC